MSDYDMMIAKLAEKYDLPISVVVLAHETFCGHYPALMKRIRCELDWPNGVTLAECLRVMRPAHHNQDFRA